MNFIAAIFLSLIVAAAGVQAQGTGGQIEFKPQGEYAKIDTSGIIRDLEILAQGSDTNKNTLVEKIKKNPGSYAPPVFMGMAQHLHEKKDAEGAYFWFAFGRMRGRYDAARCADKSARQGIDVMVMNVDPDLRKYPFRIKPDEIVPLANKILKLDKETPYNYDHRWLNLHGMGAFTGDKKELSLPESQWPALLKTVRDDFLKGAEELAIELKNPKKE